MPTENFDLLICNGVVVTHNEKQRLDVGVRDGKITALAPSLSQDATLNIDASDRFVFPGFIDAHTHMGIPIMDTCSVDDFQSGSVAAACGGVTTIIDFTVQEKGQTLRESVGVRLQNAQGRCHVDYGLHVNVTDEPETRVQEIPRLIEQGFCSFKVFSTYREAGMMVTWDQFRLILSKVNEHGGLLMLHAEDNELVETLTEQQVSSGRKDAIYHTRSRTPEAEAKAINQAAQIAKELDASLYIVHLSSRLGLEAGLRARDKGVRLYLETCPQYLVLNEEYYQKRDGHFYITTPPLRTNEDSEALWQGLGQGLIDVVATDHCPFTVQQKNRGDQAFYRVPNGLPGVETLFPILYTYGVSHGRITLEQMVGLLAKNPAQIFGLLPRKGTIRIGADADLVIWDPKVEQEIATNKLHGNANWSPYEGSTITGKLDYTILRGQILVKDNHFLGETIFGELQL